MSTDYCGEETQMVETNVRPSEAPQEREMAENEIIHRARQQDAAAFEWLYKSHSRRVYAVCLRMLGNISEAEDLTQETFLQVFRKIHTFRAESAFSTWLHRMTVNLVLMRLRKKTVGEVPLEEEIGGGQAKGRFQKERAQADLSFNRSIDHACLEHAMKRLPSGHKMVIELHDVQGYKHTEIAEIMQCSVGTSKAQLHRARKKLRELLREKFSWGWRAPAERSQMSLTASW